MSPSAFADRFASRSRSMDMTPCDNIVDFPFRCTTLSVADTRSGSVSGSSSESDVDGEDRVGLTRFCFAVRRFLRALLAHSGAGLIASNCLRRRLSYSRPPMPSSESASRSFRRRLFVARETWMFVSSGSVHAGAFRVNFLITS